MPLIETIIINEQLSVNSVNVKYLNTLCFRLFLCKSIGEMLRCAFDPQLPTYDIVQTYR